MSETTTPIEDGALVRLTRSHHDLGIGTEFRVDEYLEPNPVAEREDDEIDAPYYYGSRNGGSFNVFVPADAVELVKTAAQMNARKVPTLTEIAKELGITDGWSDAFEIDEWIRSGDEIECYAKTDEGLPFGFRVKVIAAWETDL